MDSSPSSLRAVLERTTAHALAYREAEDAAPVAALADYATLRRRLDIGLSDTGIGSQQVIEDLIAGVSGGLHNTTGGRFFGWVMGGSVPSALAADWLASAWDQNAGLFAVAPAASVVEEIAGAWLKAVLRLPPGASFALVTGCQMAHTTCLAAARHALLRDRGWNVEQDGLAGAPAIRILTSTEVHATVPRAARLLGLGARSIVHLPAGEDGRLSEPALLQALQQHPDAPTIVLLQAGDLHMGAFDDFALLLPLAKRFGAWVHIDGAFGLWAAASPRFRSLMAGAELADSWATDGHKWLNVPYDCGYAFVRDTQAHRAAFTVSASYVSGSSTAREPLDWTPEWSRRARGFATYAALRELGREGIASLIERCCDQARALTVGLGALPGAELLWEPTLNQGLVRFFHPAPTADPADHDRFTDQVTAAIAASGHALFSNTTWRGRRAMRISVCNWQTSAEDVEQVVAGAAEVLTALRAQARYPARLATAPLAPAGTLQPPHLS